MTLKKTLIEEKRKLLPGPEFRGVPLSANFCFNILFDLKTLYILGFIFSCREILAKKNFSNQKFSVCGT